MKITKELIEQMLTFMRQRNLQNNEFARLIGVTDQTLSRWINCKVSTAT